MTFAKRGSAAPCTPRGSPSSARRSDDVVIAANNAFSTHRAVVRFAEFSADDLRHRGGQLRVPGSVERDVLKDPSLGSRDGEVAGLRCKPTRHLVDHLYLGGRQWEQPNVFR